MTTIPFSHQGQDGHVAVTLEITRDPARLGTHSGALNLPYCQAAIEYPDAGYLGLFGWVQLVKSDDNLFQGRQFEMDPFDLFGLYKQAPTPFCWYGIKPTLFDAPARRDRRNLQWIAHSFLATTPFGSDTRSVTPLLGFSWGFQIDSEEITVLPVTSLTAEDWASHQPYLAESYNGWQFLAMAN